MSDFQCSNGYPEVTSTGRNKGDTLGKTITRLIPELKFPCDGIITQFMVGGAARNGEQDPKIQIWRENPNQCGAYFKVVPDIAITETVCINMMPLMTGLTVFQCTLKEASRVKVRAGDILGIELPPVTDDDFVMRFTSGGPTNYVFVNLSSTVFLSNRDSEVQEQPQINITVETLTPTGMTQISIIAVT